MFSSSRVLAAPLSEQAEPFLLAQRVMWAAAFLMDAARGRVDAERGRQDSEDAREAAFEDEAPLVSY